MEPKATLDNRLCQSSQSPENCIKLGPGGKQRVRGECILVGGENTRVLGATGRGTKEQADQ